MKNALLLKLLEPIATLASGIGKQKKLLIMIYHRVLDEPDFMRPDEVDKEAFTWHMELLAKHFNVLPLSEALERMQNDTLPPRAVSITFDDGYADNYTNALPILKRFDLTATFFIASGFLDGGRMWNDTVIEAVRNYPQAELNLTQIGLGRYKVSDKADKVATANSIICQVKHLPPEQRSCHVAYIAAQSINLPGNLMMSSVQLNQLARNRMEIGGHTVNHPILSKLDEETVRWEITKNKKLLEDSLNVELKIFAYPNGKPKMDYLQQHLEIVKNSGFFAAVSTRLGVAKKATNFFELPRFTPWDHEPPKFMLRIIQYFAKG